MTRQELPAFLFERGIVARADAVDGRLAIVSMQRGRYALHEVYVNEQPRVMAKAALQPQDCVTLRAEASMLSLLGRHQHLRGIAPRCVAVDATGRMLVMEHLGHSASLPTPSAVERAHAAGRTLAALHAQTAGAAHGFTRDLPPVFAAVRQGLTATPAALAQLWRLMSEPDLVASSIERAAALWRPQTLIHSDVKSEHWIERTPPSPGDARLIDWELVRFGDPAWDAGSVLHEHLLTHPPATTSAGAAPYLPIESRAFVTSYRQGAGGMLLDGFPVRVALCTGVRLVQTAFEMLSADQQSDGAGASLILQTAEAVFRHHEPLALDLFFNAA